STVRNPRRTSPLFSLLPPPSARKEHSPAVSAVAEPAPGLGHRASALRPTGTPPRGCRRPAFFQVVPYSRRFHRPSGAEFLSTAPLRPLPAYRARTSLLLPRLPASPR